MKRRALTVKQSPGTSMQAMLLDMKTCNAHIRENQNVLLRNILDRAVPASQGITQPLVRVNETLATIGISSPVPTMHNFRVHNSRSWMIFSVAASPDTNEGAGTNVKHAWRLETMLFHMDGKTAIKSEDLKYEDGPEWFSTWDDVAAEYMRVLELTLIQRPPQP
jgi:hypothetical protein